ncbi:MAG: PASTA domain-containing protein [Bacteroidetes bacterium]|nr:PASTA domain-containing protein [Bacteroidota bacterium]
MQAFFSFIKSKQFFIHLALILVSLFLIFFLLIKWLSSYTNHGEYVEVPDFTNVPMTELDNVIKDKDVTYQVIDSVYDPKSKPGIVIRQDPEPNVKVKHNRTVYLYVTGMVAPRIKMPKLIDRSERQARLIVGTYGLKMGHVTEKHSDCNGCVLAQMVDGKEIEPGTPVKKGSVVSLVVGIKDSYYTSSPGDTATVMPD